MRPWQECATLRRRVLGGTTCARSIPVLFGLGGFLLVAGLVCWLWAPGVVKKTPLDVNTTTHLSGQAQKLNTATGALDSNPVNATSITKTDSKASDDKVVVWANTSCLVIDDGQPPGLRRRSGSPPRLGQHRRVRHRPRDRAGCQRQQVPAGRRRRAPRPGQQVPLRHREEDLSLLGRHARQGRRREVLRHGQGRRAPTPTSSRSSPRTSPSTSPRASRAPTPTRPRSTSSRRTGAILNQTDDQQRFLDSGDKVLDLQLAFTSAQQQQSVDDSNSNLRLLNLVEWIVPVVGIVGGLLCLGIACSCCCPQDVAATPPTCGAPRACTRLTRRFAGAEVLRPSRDSGWSALGSMVVPEGAPRLGNTLENP